jgi:hypothetical protein
MILGSAPRPRPSVELGERSNDPEATDSCEEELLEAPEALGRG